MNERCSDLMSPVVLRGAGGTDGKPQFADYTSIRASERSGTRSAREPAIRIADMPSVCLAEGPGVLIRSRVIRLELFRVERDGRKQPCVDYSSRMRKIAVARTAFTR